MATEWYYANGDQQLGPISETELKSLIQSGNLGKSDLVWNDSLTEWVPVGSVQSLNASAPPKKSPPPLPTGAASSPTTTAPTTADADARMKIPVGQKHFARTREDLALLQSDVGKWFTSKGFNVSLHAEGTLRTVAAGKDSFLRKLSGNRQKWIVRIEQHPDGYNVALGHGLLEERSGGEKAATALANLYTFGAPAIAGAIIGTKEIDSVKAEFWEWLMGRSSKVCPQCQKNNAKQGTRLKDLGVTTSHEAFYGERYKVKVASCITECSCKFCSAIWTEGEPQNTKTFEWTCPECENTGDYDCACLDRASEIVCKNCKASFQTAAQQEYQYDLQEQEILAAIEAKQKTLDLNEVAVNTSLMVHDRRNANDMMIVRQGLKSEILQLQQLLMQVRAERDRRSP